MEDPSPDTVIGSYRIVYQLVSARALYAEIWVPNAANAILRLTLMIAL